MGFCVWCGHAVSGTAKFCMTCGKQLPDVAPQTNTAEQGDRPSPNVVSSAPPSTQPPPPRPPPSNPALAPASTTTPAPQPPSQSEAEEHFLEMSQALVGETHDLSLGDTVEAVDIDYNQGSTSAGDSQPSHPSEGQTPGMGVTPSVSAPPPASADTTPSAPPLRSLQEDMNTMPVPVPPARLGTHVEDDVGKRPKRKIRILSIDGGGIRGIMPAIVLDHLERSSGRRIVDMFDFLSGTSTGGLLALGVSVPNPQNPTRPLYSAMDALQLYYNRGSFIFTADRGGRRGPSSPYAPHQYEGIIDRMARKTKEGMREAMGKAMLACKYGSNNIETVLSEYFGNCRLSQSMRPLLIPAYEIERRHPFFFKSAQARAYPAQCDFEMRSVARATSAAPLYFPPTKINYNTPQGPRYHALVDGGVVANNPAMLAYAEAQSLFPDCDFTVVSLGTGQLDTPIMYAQAKDWGIAGWAMPLLDSMFTGSSDVVDYQLAQLLNEKADGVPRYYRFTAILNKDMSDLDNATPQNLRAITQVTHQSILQHRAADLQRLVRQLTED